MRTAQKTEFITQVQTHITNMLGSLNSLLSLKNEYVSLGLGTAIIDEDFNVAVQTIAGSNSFAGLTAAEFKAAMTTVLAIDTYLQGDKYTTLYKLKKL